MKSLVFFLGTEAELIKVFPVILKARERGVPCLLIASGQNDVVHSLILKTTGCGQVDLELSREEDIRKNVTGLFSWWAGTYRKALGKIRRAFPDYDFKNARMVVHGDTVSTYMGARLGCKLGMQVCHIEAGLRSHHLFSPFPEEIDRLLTSRIATMHFAPGGAACQNLQKAKGQVINTLQNTLLDSLRYSEQIPVTHERVARILPEDYFVFVMHRQENVIRKAFVIEAVEEIRKAAKKRKCVILLHKITENAFEKFGLMKELAEDDRIEMLPRVDYFDFMKLLKYSAFVITDGGSNQEELFYMRKPCLILRTATERNEGLGITARLYDGTAGDIAVFLKELEDGKFTVPESLLDDVCPSDIIMDAMMKE